MKIYFKVSILLFLAIASYAQSASTSEQKSFIDLVAANRINISTNLVFTTHALERMKKRQINGKAVRRTINTGNISIDKNENVCMFEKDGCRVILDINGSSNRVITLYNKKSDPFHKTKPKTKPIEIHENKQLSPQQIKKQALSLERKRKEKARSIQRQKARDKYRAGRRRRRRKR